MMSVSFPDVSTISNEYASAAYFLFARTERTCCWPKSLLLTKQRRNQGDTPGA